MNERSGLGPAAGRGLRHTSRTLTRSAGGVAGWSGLVLGVCLALSGCLGGGGGGGGNSPKEGELCEPPDNENGKACVGTVRYDCEEEPIIGPGGEETGTEFRWEFDEDCADKGEICRDGQCVDAPANTTCASVAGRWTFTGHCDPAELNRSFTVTQDGCDIASPDGAFRKGDLKPDNTDMKIKGTTPAGEDFECEGTVSGGTFSLDCGNGCLVTGRRN